MQVGRELDALIAEKVFGLPGRFVEAVYVNGRWVDALTWIGIDEDSSNPTPGRRGGDMPPRYSTDIAAAWLVHTHCCEQLFSRRMNYLDALGFLLQTEAFANMRDARGIEAFPSAMRNLSPRLICLAALKAQ